MKMVFNRVILSVFYILSLIATYTQSLVSEDPDETRTVPEIIESRGFKSETHYVTTKDGYILTIHRIINPNSTTTIKRPVILQHGIITSSYVFITNAWGLGTENSKTYLNNKLVSNNMAFALSMFHYDIWLTNSRGNEYGKNHTTLNPNGRQFWKFSFDQMSEFDLPATIEYILQATHQTSLGYVGYSQGSTIMFSLLASQPKYSQIIKPFVALAPVAKLAHIKSPIRYFAYNPLVVSALYLKAGMFYPGIEFLRHISRTICKESLIAYFFCSNIPFLMAGFDRKQLNITRLPVLVAHSPDSTSDWNMVHMTQLIRSGKFAKFDFGIAGNLKRYGTAYPPEYNLRNIKSANIALISARNDWFGDQEDIDFIREQAKDNIIFDHIVPYNCWSHLDFLWATELAKYVNVKVIEILSKF